MFQSCQPAPVRRFIITVRCHGLPSCADHARTRKGMRIVATLGRGLRDVVPDASAAARTPASCARHLATEDPARSQAGPGSQWQNAVPPVSDKPARSVRASLRGARAAPAPSNPASAHPIGASRISSPLDLSCFCAREASIRGRAIQHEVTGFGNLAGRSEGAGRSGRSIFQSDSSTTEGQTEGFIARVRRPSRQSLHDAPLSTMVRSSRCRSRRSRPCRSNRPAFPACCA
jgi:hypothetical protein